MGEIPEGRLTLTNDNTRSVAIGVKVLAVVALVMGIFMVIGPVWAWWTAAVKTPGHWANMVVCCPIGIGFVFGAFQVWVLSGLFTWDLDSEGIEFQGPRGGRRCLRWQDVERVRWSHEGVRLLGRGERIDLNWKQLKPERQPEAARALLHFLGRDFDLPTPAEEGRKWSEIWVPISKTAIFVVWMIISFVVSKHLTVILLSALLPAVAPLAGPLLRDETVLKYASFTFFMAIWVGLLSPFRILAKNKVWFDRQVH